MGGRDRCNIFYCSRDGRCPHSKQWWRETSGNLNCIFCKCKIALSFWEDKQTRLRLLVLRHFITCLPPEIPRDISFIPSILERVQRWWVSWIRSITSCYWRSFSYFPYSSCLSFIFHSSIHPSPQLYIHRSFVPLFIHSTLEFESMISLHQSLYGQVFKPRCSFH